MIVQLSRIIARRTQQLVGGDRPASSRAATFAVVPISPCTAVAPRATMTFGETSASWSVRNELQAVISSGSGLRLSGGRHFTMLQT